MTDNGWTRRHSALAAGLGTVLIVLAACSTATSSSSAATASASSSESQAASSSASESAATGPRLTISGSASFGAPEITVPAGEKLTVNNVSSFPHTFTEGEDGVEADNARVNETVEAGTIVEIEFPEPGDYNITCKIHPGMNMVVHVE